MINEVKDGIKNFPNDLLKIELSDSDRENSSFVLRIDYLPGEIRTKDEISKTIYLGGK